MFVHSLFLLCLSIVGPSGKSDVPPPSAVTKKLQFGSSSSSKVHPIDAEPVEDDKQGGTVTSKSSTIDMRTTFDRNTTTEERGVVIMRRLLMGVIVAVGIVAVVLAILSKSVITSGIDSALAVEAYGSRSVSQQVTGVDSCCSRFVTMS